MLWNASGRYGGAFEWPNNKSRIEVYNSTSLNNMSNFTIALWYYADTSSKARNFVSKDGDGSQGIDFRITTDDAIQLNVDCTGTDLKKYTQNNALQEGAPQAPQSMPGSFCANSSIFAIF